MMLILETRTLISVLKTFIRKWRGWGGAIPCQCNNRYFSHSHEKETDAMFGEGYTLNHGSKGCSTPSEEWHLLEIVHGALIARVLAILCREPRGLEMPVSAFRLLEGSIHRSAKTTQNGIDE